MSASLTAKITGDKSMANDEQPLVFSKEVSLTKVVSWPEDLDEGQSFTKADFEKDLRKVTRKIKK